MDSLTYRQRYAARHAIAIAKRAKAASASPIGKSFAFTLRFSRYMTQHFLDWGFIRERRETEVAVAVLMIMNNDAIRDTQWLG